MAHKIIVEHQDCMVFNCTFLKVNVIVVSWPVILALVPRHLPAFCRMQHIKKLVRDEAVLILVLG